MCSLVRKQFTPDQPCVAIPTLPDSAENNAEWDTLLFALGSLWLNGVTISWDGFYTHEDRQRIPLPGYPFERQRFWVDPAPVAPAAHAQFVLPEVIGATHENSTELLGSPVAAENPHQQSLFSSRKDRIASRVIDLLIAVSGRERSQIGEATTFMEQGFDSLSLTQVAFAIRKEFSVKVTFSQLMNQFPNVDMLSEPIDVSVPAGIISDSSAKSTNLPDPQQPDANAEIAKEPINTIAAKHEDTIARLVALLNDPAYRCRHRSQPPLTRPQF